MKNKPCCEILEKLNIKWMRTGDGSKCMPYTRSDDNTMYRVNYCPSCGKNIRDIMITGVTPSEGESNK